MKPLEAANCFKWREVEKNAKNTETLTNRGGFKERKSMFIDPQRPYFPRKKRAFCSSVPGLDSSFANPVKDVPLRAQKAFLGTCPPTKRRKIRAFRKTKNPKNVVFEGWASKTTTAPQKKSLFGKPWRGSLRAGFGRVFAPRASRTREKARF